MISDSPRIIVSAPTRSSGKTTVAIGLCHALRSRGMTVQPFKKGPDYIDPMWMSAAAGRSCRNLDFYMMGDEGILRSYQTSSADSDISVIEGNLGLFDGLDLEGSDSTAGLAHFLRSPVVLVVDTLGMNRGVAALLSGYMNFDSDTQIAGVILNRVSGPRHEKKLIDSINRFSGAEILGVIPKAPDKIGLEERHLGLVPVKEDPALSEKIGAMGEIIGQNCDIDRIMRIAESAGPLPPVEPCPKPSTGRDIAIGVAMDRAFNFYYPENLEALEAAGAELVPFSPLEDESLPPVNALYIGGGFPEIFIDQLEANEPMRRAVREEAGRGLPIYAECGGMMYLARSINWGDISGQMVGALDFDVQMTKRPMGLGYMKLEATGECGWLRPGGAVPCHEFHHSKITGLAGDEKFAWKVLRGAGMANERDGVLHKNLLASYAHLHACGAPFWAESFTAFIRETGATVKQS